MKKSVTAPNRLRAGLTLMELLVVVTILAALAGIALPMFPSFLRRAHKASDATQSGEVSKLIQTYQASYMGYPNDWDLLTDGTSNDATGTYDYLPNTAGAPFGGFTTTGTLTTFQVGALNSAGITTAQPMAKNYAGLTADGDGVKQPTLMPYLTYPMPTSSPISATTVVRLVNLTAAQTANPGFLEQVKNAAVNDSQYDATNHPLTFALFGVGPRSSMVGKVVQDAPTSVPQNPTLTPAKFYCHFGAIFMVDGPEVMRTGRARLIAVVAMEDDELELTTKDTIGYYQVAE